MRLPLVKPANLPNHEFDFAGSDEDGGGEEDGPVEMTWGPRTGQLDRQLDPACNGFRHQTE